MSINPPRSDPEDPHVAVAIDRAERRRAKLERLSDIGLAMIEQVGAHAAAAMAAVNEDNRGDSGRSFATLSRAVRMTLALEARFDEHILTLRRGDPPAARRVRAQTAPTPAAQPEAAQPPAAKPSDPRRDRADAAVREAIYIEVETLDLARERLDALNERLFDTEAYDALLDLPFRGVVAAICADLGLQPDWGLWSEDAETGFVAPPGRRRVNWTTLVAQSYPGRKTPPSKPPPDRG